MPFLSTQELIIPAHSHAEPEWHTLLWVAVGFAGGILLGAATTVAAALSGSPS